MDKIKAFLDAMTFWNWLSLIAFIFFPLSALNSFFSLRSRFLDWRGIQNRKAFEKRVKQLERELAKITNFTDNPRLFYGYLLDRGTRLLSVVLMAIGFFILAFGATVLPVNVFTLASLFTMAAVFLLFLAITILFDLNKLIRVVNDPVKFAVELVKFKVEARAKGFELNNDGPLMKFLRQVKTEGLAKHDKLMHYVIDAEK